MGANINLTKKGNPWLLKCWVTQNPNAWLPPLIQPPDLTFQKMELGEVCFCFHFSQKKCIFEFISIKRSQTPLWSDRWSRCGYFCSESLNLILVPSEGTELKLFIRILLTLSVAIKLASHKVLLCPTCILDSTFTTDFKGDVSGEIDKMLNSKADVYVEVHAGKHSDYRPFLC